jgi:hypothetical protein
MRHRALSNKAYDVADSVLVELSSPLLGLRFGNIGGIGSASDVFIARCCITCLGICS